MGCGAKEKLEEKVTEKVFEEERICSSSKFCQYPLIQEVIVKVSGVKTLSL
jgi:hypothetical protein